MRLAFIIQSLSAGGAERVTANLANHWARHGIEVCVITLEPESSDFYSLEFDVTRVSLDCASDSHSTFVALKRNLHRVAKLRRALKEFRPDVAVAMMSTSNVLLAIASARLSQMVKVGSERTHPPALPLQRSWEILRKYLYSQLNAVVALTEESARWVRENTNARRVLVVPNPVVWPLVEEPQSDPPIEHEGRNTLLAVGRLSREKGFDILIRAFQKLSSEFPGWRLVIVGEGNCRAELEAQAASAGLNDRVILPGRIRNIRQWYESSDIFVMTSHFEGFPNTLVEAMSHGLPAVSFDCDTGPRDIIRHGIDGTLVPPGSESKLIAALRDLMEDASLRSRFGQNAIDVRSRFSMQVVSDRWTSLFDELGKAVHA